MANSRPFATLNQSPPPLATPRVMLIERWYKSTETSIDSDEAVSMPPIMNTAIRLITCEPAPDPSTIGIFPLLSQRIA
jgi:hypothetical protein